MQHQNCKILEFDDLKNRSGRQLICEVCHTNFMCDSNSEVGCWCMTIEQKVIDENLKDCICENCLSKAVNCR